MSVPGAKPVAVERVEKVNGADLHYWLYREDLLSAEPETSTPIVMVHGLRGTHEGLQLIVERLPDRCVVVPDLPGYGDSTPMAGHRHDVPGYASAVTGLLDRLDAGARPVTLLGHSFGSVVAAHVAVSVPELVRRLVLVNPIASPPLRGPRVLLSELTSAYYALGKALPPRWGTALLSNKVIVLAASRAMLRSKDKRIRRFVYDSHLQHFSRFHNAEVLTESYEASVTRTVADYAARLPMPTLLIAGESDEIAPVEGQRQLVRKLPDAELVVIPDVGHLVHYETPGATADEIERFLRVRGDGGEAQ